MQGQKNIKKIKPLGPEQYLKFNPQRHLRASLNLKSYERL